MGEGTVSPSVGQFGPAVLGQEAFEAEQKIVEKGETKFGPAVLEHAEKEGRAPTLDEEVRAHKPSAVGKNVPGPAVDSAPAPEPGAEKAADYVALPLEGKKGLYAVLEANPALVPRIFDAELDRPDGPRKGALEKLHSIEAAKELPDEALLTEIEEALEALEQG